MDDSVASLERRESVPAKVRVCFVVWKILPPTLMETMFDSLAVAGIFIGANHTTFCFFTQREREFNLKEFLVTSKS